jgi:hypothetical protein
VALLELAGSLGENQALGEFHGILGDERLGLLDQLLG